MRYRRLGQTDLMVSEIGLEVRPALAEGEEAAAAALRAAIDAGVTVFAWDVSDATPDVEPLLVRAAGVDRGRLTLVAALDNLPAPQDIGPQVEAIASRLADDQGEGYLDVVALPGLPDDAQLGALGEARGRGIVRFVALAAAADARLPSPLPAGIDVLVLGGLPASDPGRPVVVRVAAEDAPALLEERGVSSVVTGAASAQELSRLLAAGS